MLVLWCHTLRCWLVYDDYRRLDASSPHLLQRYVLALFYFSTNGDKWKKSLGYLTAKNECHWGGITCANERITEFIIRK